MTSTGEEHEFEVSNALAELETVEQRSLRRVRTAEAARSGEQEIDVDWSALEAEPASDDDDVS